MKNLEKILLGHFVEYRKFVGTIEICNGTYCGHIENTDDDIYYKANTIEEMFEEYKNVIDLHIITKKKEVSCNEFLTNDCIFNCTKCLCRKCRYNDRCQYDYAPYGCGNE